MDLDLIVKSRKARMREFIGHEEERRGSLDREPGAGIIKYTSSFPKKLRISFQSRTSHFLGGFAATLRQRPQGQTLWVQQLRPAGSTMGALRKNTSLRLGRFCVAFSTMCEELRLYILNKSLKAHVT